MAQEIRNRKMMLTGEVPITKILTIQIVGEVSDYTVKINGIVVTGLTHSFRIDTLIASVEVSSPTEEFVPEFYTQILMNDNKTLVFTVKLPPDENYLTGFVPIEFNDWDFSQNTFTPPATYSNNWESFAFNTQLRMGIGSEVGAKIEAESGFGIAMMSEVVANWWSDEVGFWLNYDKTFEYWVPTNDYQTIPGLIGVPGTWVTMKRASRTKFELYIYETNSSLPTKVAEREVTNTSVASMDEVSFIFALAGDMFSYPQGKGLIIV